MSDIAIRVENLSKRYIISHQRAGGGGLRHVLQEKLTAPWRAVRRHMRRGKAEAGGQDSQSASEEFWALRDVSFELKQGEAVGIIGRNGAGKSTMLKILSRITEPTSGRIDIAGRVASLLEVGTGFHPELTGRENIFLNGAILGMSRQEIKAKFDEIVAFAEVERFLDTPVKRYSSGMYVRLAFAVAAHLEPEILIVDEVLAVGDVQFQKKCLGKMGEVASEGGRTVLFVSHNMRAIEALCQRTVWLNAGRVERDDVSSKVVNAYLTRLQTGAGESAVLRSLNNELEILCVVTRNEQGEPTNCFPSWSSMTVEIHYRAAQPVRNPYLWIGIDSQWGPLFGASMMMDGRRPELLHGDGKIGCTFRSLPLLPNQTYTIRMGGKDERQNQLFKPADVGSFHVTGSAKEAGLLGELADSLVGHSSPVMVDYEWQFPNEQASQPGIALTA